MEPVHRSRVSRPLSRRDPASHRGRRAYTTLSATSVGIELAASVGIGALFGHWLDGKAGTTPWLMLLFVVLGFVAGMRGVLRIMHRLDREDRADAEDRRARDREAGHG